MGFRLDRTYVLAFEGAMEGAYVKIKATPVGVVLKLRSNDWETVEELATLLTQYVIEWNLDGLDGEPLPITAEAIVGGLEQPVLIKILTEWAKAAAGITAPLDPPIEEIPMEPVP